MKSRMYDRLCHRGVMPSVFKPLIDENMPCCVIDDVAKWYFEGMLKEESWWDETQDFPILVPPFNYMWMEFRTPKMVREIVQADDEEGSDFKHVGFLIEHYSVADVHQAPFGVKQLTFAAMSGRDTEYITRIHVFVESDQIQSDDGPVHMWTWVYPVAGDGMIRPDTGVTQGKGIFMGGSSTCTTIGPDELEAAQASFKSLSLIPMFALSFMWSPLVDVDKIKDHEPKKEKKNRHKAPRAAKNYFRLGIDKVVEFISREGKEAEVGQKQAFRDTKDHFRDPYVAMQQQKKEAESEEVQRPSD